MKVFNPSSVDSNIIIDGVTHTISAGQTRDFPEAIAAQLIGTHQFLSYSAPEAKVEKAVAKPKKVEVEEED